MTTQKLLSVFTTASSSALAGTCFIQASWALSAPTAVSNKTNQSHANDVLVPHPTASASPFQTAALLGTPPNRGPPETLKKH